MKPTAGVPHATLVPPSPASYRPSCGNPPWALHASRKANGDAPGRAEARDAAVDVRTLWLRCDSCQPIVS